MIFFNKNFKLIFDRSFSSGLGKQIKWLLVIVLGTYAVLFILSLFKTFYSPTEGGFFDRLYDITFLLMDPGSNSDHMSSPFVIL